MFKSILYIGTIAITYEVVFIDQDHAYQCFSSLSLDDPIN